MKEHVMNLTPAPMQEIRTGNKTIELRLNDEKRKQIKKGDIITFLKEPDRIESMKAFVTDLESGCKSLAITFAFNLFPSKSVVPPPIKGSKITKSLKSIFS